MSEIFKMACCCFVLFVVLNFNFCFPVQKTDTIILDCDTEPVVPSRPHKPKRLTEEYKGTSSDSQRVSFLHIIFKRKCTLVDSKLSTGHM